MAGPRFSTRKKKGEPTKLQLANQWRFGIQGRMEGCYAQLIDINKLLNYPIPDTILLQAKIHMMGRLDTLYQMKKGVETK
jgi:hypothetical protein